MLLVGAFAAYSLYPRANAPGDCSPLTSDVPARYQAGIVRFGAVTEYCLAGPVRMSNGIAVAPDGSVWFGEQSVPGLGRLFPNGTVNEYAWPSPDDQAPRIGGYKSGIWGVSFWNGMAWAADSSRSLLIGISPTDGATVTINVSAAVPYPFTTTVGPDDALWFTSLSSTAKLGRLDGNHDLAVLPVEGLGGEKPIQVDFVNASLGYMVAFDQRGSGHLYSFDPQASGTSISARRLGGDAPLTSPDSVSAFGGLVWVVQHLPASVTAFEPGTDSWTTFPTSTISYENTTLPYFIEATGTGVWFNEHYANRVAFLDPGTGTLTEYGETSQPVTSFTQVQDDLTISAVQGGLWFTSWNGNYIGFVNKSVAPAFSISVQGSNRLSMSTGETKAVQLQVSGSWPTALRVSVSDSENYRSVPTLASVVPDRTTIPAGAGQIGLAVAVGTRAGLEPREYTVAVTVSDGIVSQTAYLFVEVS